MMRCSPQRTAAAETEVMRGRGRMAPLDVAARVKAKDLSERKRGEPELCNFHFAKLASRSTPGRVIMPSDPGGTHGFPSRRAARNKPERHAPVPEKVPVQAVPHFPHFPHFPRCTRCRREAGSSKRKRPVCPRLAVPSGLSSACGLPRCRITSATANAVPPALTLRTAQASRLTCCLPPRGFVLRRLRCRSRGLARSVVALGCAEAAQFFRVVREPDPSHCPIAVPRNRR